MGFSMQAIRKYALHLFVLASSFTASVGHAAEENTFYSDLARDWYEGGDYFEWQSTTSNNDGASVDVFYRTFGNPDNP